VTEDPYKKIKELEEKISFLQAENESMAERAEEIFLLVMVSESIREINDRSTIVDTVLEKISILKDIPLCCYCSRDKNTLTVRLAYVSYADTTSLQNIKLDENAFNKLQNGILYLVRDNMLYEEVFKSLNEKNFDPKSVLIIPHKSISNKLSYLLFADNDQDTNRFSEIMTLIHEVINIMSDKLDNLYLLEELRKINLDLERKITDRTSELWEINRLLRKEIEEKRLAEEELKLKNEELNNFVYRVSHDLRAPITSVEGLINIIKLELQSKSSDLRPFINLLEDRMKNLDRFIYDILNYSRNISTSVTIENIDFKSIISNCFDELEYLDNAMRIRKTIEVTEKPFFNDKMGIHEIFRNIISNAIKYADKSKEDNTIYINIKINKKEATVSIQDNGIGISWEVQPKIFEMFYRGSELSKGSGIGLYLVSQSVDKMGGKIDVKSALGKGTEFIVRLPNRMNK
jgi:signal transduction histidine kinase